MGLGPGDMVKENDFIQSPAFLDWLCAALAATKRRKGHRSSPSLEGPLPGFQQAATSLKNHSNEKPEHTESGSSMNLVDIPCCFSG